ncbi:MAG: hypothetical protein GY942_03185 [Aestuariibacter sp.]|nr:hypothetical protein [Aestuariibacter sp.]
MSLWKTLVSRWGSGAGEIDDVRIDFSTNSLQTVEYDHHEIHGGSSYHLSLTTENLGGETGDHLHISFTTPDTTKWFHLVAHAYGSGQNNFQIREAPTGGMVGGSAMTPLNRNRNSVNTSGALLPVSGATVGTGGTLLVDEDRGQGNSNIGESRGTQEWMLKQDTLYSFRIYDTTNIQAVLILDWYEHTNKH